MTADGLEIEDSSGTQGTPLLVFGNLCTLFAWYKLSCLAFIEGL